ncbi:MAG: hypothetical protein AB1896_01965 [Thermodesulfobacteriota bacterium]
MKISRRKFVGGALGLGALAWAGGCMLGGCGRGLAREDLESGIPGSGPAPELDDRRRAVLYYASLAPSGHNSQPWYVKLVGPDEWIIGADPARRLPAVDPENREVLLSLGAFAENLVLAAGSLGLEAEIEVLAQTSSDEEVLRVRLKEGRPTGYPLPRLSLRMTPKRGYRPEELTEEVVGALAGPHDGRLFYFPRGTSHAQCLEAGAVENFRRQLERDEAQAEMVRWTRLSDGAAREHRDGLTVEGMEIRGLAGWFARHFLKPEDFLTAGNRKRSLDHTTRLAAEGGGWMVITGPGPSVGDLIETGRRFERTALLARELGVGLHPMTQYLEEEPGRAEVAKNHGPEMSPQFVLRVGYLDRYPRPVSLRRPVSWFVRT